MVARDKSEQRKRDLDLQLRYLKLADRLGLQIDWNHYATWGTPTELRTMSFAKWWKTRGSKLVERNDGSEIEVESVTPTTVVMRIPRNWTVRKLVKHIGPAFDKHRQKNTKQSRVRPREFVNYARLLEIELSPSVSGAKKWQKFAKFLKDKKDRDERTAAWRKTRGANLAKRGKTLRKDRRKAKRHNERNYQRWLHRAKAIAANVARGQFPGSVA